MKEQRDRSNAARQPGSRGAENRWRKFRITQAEYDAMRARQGEVCALCRKPERVIDKRNGLPRSLAVDHCHLTGRIRGLLCGACNQALGLLQDDLETVRRILDYLA